MPFTLSLYAGICRLLLLIVHAVKLLPEVAAADFTGNAPKFFGTQFTIQALTVNRLNFYSVGKKERTPEYLLRTLFWLDESVLDGMNRPITGRFGRRWRCISMP